jgi:hypothetical protein
MELLILRESGLSMSFCDAPSGYMAKLWAAGMDWSNEKTGNRDQGTEKTVAQLNS